MDVLAQALSVVERSEASVGEVTLCFDLSQPAQRAAYAAAAAVLAASGLDPRSLETLNPAPQALSLVDALPDTASESDNLVDHDDADLSPEVREADARLRRGYLEALSELTVDQDRQIVVANDTFPRIRDLLHGGANVASVAQVQYRRWVEEHLDAVRGN